MADSPAWPASQRQYEHLLGLADDELVIGWRDSEWTGIAPVLEEDVAFSSIAQNEIGHARAVYEVADEIRITALMEELPLAAKINREEAYHRMHAELWHGRLAGTPQFRAAVDDLWPYAVTVLPLEQRPVLAARVGRDLPSNSLLLGKERGTQGAAFVALHEEMTSVRRSAPAGAQW